MSFLIIWSVFLCLWVGHVNGGPDLVTKECNSGLKNIDSIGKFELFVANYKTLIANSEKPKRGLLNLDKKLRKCYDLEDGLKELELIVADRDKGVCQKSYIDRLVKFHERFLTSRGSLSEKAHTAHEGSESSYLARFFSLFAHQVALTCKSQLSSRLEEAQNKRDCSIVLSRYMPKTIGLDDADNDANEVTKFMSHFKKVEEFMPISRVDSLNKAEFYYDIIIPPEVVEKINSLRAECTVREPYYTTLFYPISTLAHLGYNIEDSPVPADAPETRETRVLSCWLATAQLCQGILRTHPIVKDDSEKVEKPVTIKFGSMPDDTKDDDDDFEEFKFVDVIHEIQPEISEIVKKKFTKMGRIKRKGQRMLKKFVERHIDIESLRQTAVEKFMTSLVDEDNGLDTGVAFSGREHTGGQYNPATVITDDVDTIVQMSTFFISGKLSLIFSCIVAVALSAVFVWFTLYAMVTVLKQKAVPSSKENFKTEWRELRDKRMDEIRKKFDKTNAKDHLMVYKPE